MAGGNLRRRPGGGGLRAGPKKSSRPRCTAPVECSNSAGTVTTNLDVCVMRAPSPARHLQTNKKKKKVCILDIINLVNNFLFPLSVLVSVLVSCDRVVEVMHLHFEKPVIDLRCDAVVSSLSWMGRVPEEQPEVIMLDRWSQVRLG